MTQPKMALSLRQPWCFLMLELALPFRKTVENREWNTSMRGDVWVHASKAMTKLEFYEACEFALEAGVPRGLLPSFDSLPRGGIVGRWTITDVMRPRGLKLVGRELVDHPRKGDPWHMAECFGMIIESARPVPFVPCNGALGFWVVPPAVLAQLPEDE
jgi:hypothetical protein